MELFTLRSRTPNKKLKRVGRGPGSGHGKTSCRGHKGAGSRSGKTLPYTGHQGGNVPYARRLPKRGFTSPLAQEFQIVNLGDIQKKLSQVAEINPESLKKVNLIQNLKQPVKILAKLDGPYSLKTIIKANAFSAKARQLIEKAGGTSECLTP